MWINILFLILGLALILWGANLLTDGASAIAKRFGISDLVVGLTVVAFGTSAPELAISIIASIAGNAPLAVGNVVGSNIFNLLVIIGVTALVAPIVIKRSVLSMEIPMVVLAALVMLIIGSGTILDGDSANVVTRVDGLLLIVFFILFMRYTFATAKSTDNADADPSAESAAAIPDMPLWRAIVSVLGGLAMLVFGGDKFVDGASGVAIALGMSEATVGLTIVAAGTSLPELATSIVAALKGKSAIAVGNVIGSNIFNTLLVLGGAAVIHPLPFGDIGQVDLLTLVGASVMFWVFGWFFSKRTINRVEGAVMVAGYIGYTWWLLSGI